jgi:hypothetical protein
MGVSVRQKVPGHALEMHGNRARRHAGGGRSNDLFG